MIFGCCSRDFGSCICESSACMLQGVFLRTTQARNVVDCYRRLVSKSGFSFVISVAHVSVTTTGFIVEEVRCRVANLTWTKRPWLFFETLNCVWTVLELQARFVSGHCLIVTAMLFRCANQRSYKISSRMRTQADDHERWRKRLLRRTT